MEFQRNVNTDIYDKGKARTLGIFVKTVSVSVLVFCVSTLYNCAHVLIKQVSFKILLKIIVEGRGNYNYIVVVF